MLQVRGGFCCKDNVIASVVYEAKQSHELKGLLRHALHMAAQFLAMTA
jgi:hypothetical protein